MWNSGFENYLEILFQFSLLVLNSQRILTLTGQPRTSHTETRISWCCKTVCLFGVLTSDLLVIEETYISFITVGSYQQKVNKNPKPLWNSSYHTYRHTHTCTTIDSIDCVNFDHIMLVYLQDCTLSSPAEANKRLDGVQLRHRIPAPQGNSVTCRRE